MDTTGTGARKARHAWCVAFGVLASGAVSRQDLVVTAGSPGGDSVIALIADTHLRGGRRLPDACVRVLKGAELILHAGDISTVAALDELRAIGPAVAAVHGNVDDPALVRRLPAALECVVKGVTLAMTHDAGPGRGRLERMRRRFPEAAAVIFGHSHIPLLEVAADGFQIFNPGSPTVRRRAPAHTLGLGHIHERTIRFEHLVI